MLLSDDFTRTLALGFVAALLNRTLDFLSSFQSPLAKLRGHYGLREAGFQSFDLNFNSGFKESILGNRDL